MLIHIVDVVCCRWSTKRPCVAGQSSRSPTEVSPVSDIQDRFRYLPITAQAKRWGLYVTCCGRVEVPPHGEHPPRDHPECYGFRWQEGRILPEYQVIYLVHGAGLFESTATGQREIVSGNVVVLFPGVWHRYRPKQGKGWRSYWIGINGGYADDLVKNGFLDPENPIVAVEGREELLAAYQRVLELACGNEPDNPAVLAAAAMEILARVFACGEGGSIEPATQPFAGVVQDRMVAEAVRFIWNHTQKDMTVDEVVSALPVSRRSLERRFQSVLGHTLLEEITRCRVERAKRLLEETDTPLKSIASQVGFSSVQRMAKVFGRSVGVPPAAYRKSRRS